MVDLHEDEVFFPSELIVTPCRLPASVPDSVTTQCAPGLEGGRAKSCGGKNARVSQPLWFVSAQLCP